MRETAKRKRASRPYIAPPVQRAVRLIRHVAEGNAVLNMSETAKRLKINRTTLLRLLHTLEVEGFVERRPGGAGYQVGLSFLELGARALFSQDLVQVAVPVLTGSRRPCSCRPISACATAPTCSISCAARPNTPLASNIRVGSRLPAHATTMGRMLLAFMAPVEVEALYAGKPLPRFSDHTSTTLAGVAGAGPSGSQRRDRLERCPFRARHQLGGGPGLRFCRFAACRDQRVGTDRRIRR